MDDNKLKELSSDFTSNNMFILVEMYLDQTRFKDEITTKSWTIKFLTLCTQHISECDNNFILVLENKPTQCKILGRLRYQKSAI